MSPASSTLPIASSALSLEIAVVGAEMQDLRDADGRSLQWDGDPAVWSGRAPILFPIVGELAGGHYRLDGREYPLGRHGFARRATFDVVAHDARSAVLRLAASDETRAVYPFEFVLDVAYTVDDTGLAIDATVANRGDRPMPASFGVHSAFRWPLPYGALRADHDIRFEREEPAPIRRLDGDGLVLPDPLPTPVDGRVLALRDALFDDDALVFDHVASRRVSYGAAGGPRIDVGFPDFPMLGVWTKPGGAHFVCIEPWQGLADPVGFDGDLFAKPGIVTIAPGASRTFSMTIAVSPADASR